MEVSYAVLGRWYFCGTKSFILRFPSAEGDVYNNAFIPEFIYLYKADRG